MKAATLSRGFFYSILLTTTILKRPNDYLWQMVDYLVVGLGLAGIAFCERLKQNGLSFKVVSDDSQTSSQVAGGLYNPVILKRFTLAWKADIQLHLAKSFYSDLESRLNVQLNYPLQVFRRFHSIEEQNQWFEASDRDSLNHFLSPKLHKNSNQYLNAPLGFGEVLHTGRIDTSALIEYYRKSLIEQNLLIQNRFEHNQLAMEQNHIFYQSTKAKRVVFCEGFGVKSNPYFDYLPINGSKGEYLLVKAPELKETRAIKSSLFIIPLGEDVYQVGANYEWKDKTNLATEVAKRWILERFEDLVTCDYEIVGQIAGVRPTVADRRPLVGRHPKYKRLFILNGFGSRGVLIAPFASSQLLRFIENDESIDDEMNVDRFEKKFS